MDNKELYEILQDYAVSTRNDKEIVFKKLNRSQKRVKQNRHKPQYIFAGLMCTIVLVLSIALPIALVDTTQNNNQTTYCSTDDLIFNSEESLDILINDYKINAKYPSYEAVMISSISAQNSSAFKGALLGYLIFDDTMLDIDLAIVPKTHILQIYEDYFIMQNTIAWDEYEVKFSVEKTTDFEYKLQIYFTDDKYDYFVTSKSDIEIEPHILLNLLYEN